MVTPPLMAIIWKSASAKETNRRRPLVFCTNLTERAVAIEDRGTPLLKVAVIDVALLMTAEELSTPWYKTMTE